jgi:hypothetical protein
MWALDHLFAFYNLCELCKIILCFVSTAAAAADAAAAAAAAASSANDDDNEGG